MTVKKTVAFVRTSKHLHTQHLTEKAAGHINQILKLVPHAHCLSTAQDQRTRQKVITRHVREARKIVSPFQEKRNPE
ncbi:hypothetical protein [Bacillus paralicheniformis]|uniref:hypothetical protein n=1 Tax=Bacillus paralicheniformis TaxID=1648923 RepID=UPI00128CEA35|nr:hypothetical protein [Bacillus paralicheniformis]MPQ25431.1 hypothetical protein [Bacillus paralicheniformis]